MERSVRQRWWAGSLAGIMLMAGMAAMSEKYREEGSELYHRADGLPVPEHH